MQEGTRDRACSLVFLPSGSALPHPHLQCQVYCVAQARCRGHSPECCSWGGPGTTFNSYDSRLAFPPAADDEGQGEKGNFFLTHTAVRQMRCGARSPMITFSCTPINRVSSIVRDLVKGKVNSLSTRGGRGEWGRAYLHLSLPSPPHGTRGGCHQLSYSHTLKATCQQGQCYSAVQTRGRAHLAAYCSWYEGGSLICHRL